MERILVVKLADLGDVLTTTPALRALRLQHPSAHVTALVTPRSAGILEGTDLVDEIVPFEQGERLFGAAPEPKRFYRVAGARHDDPFADPALVDAVATFAQDAARR